MLKRIIESINESEDSIVFETLIGRNPNVSPDSYDTGAWYGANITWYGTKWDVTYEDCNFDFTDESITFGPQTAWSPPIQFGVNLAKAYNVNVELFYSESGCDFCGITTINSEGVPTEDDYTFLGGLYKFDNDSFWEEVKMTIDYYIESEEGENTFEKMIKDNSFSTYLTPEDMDEAKTMFDEQLEEHILETKDEE